MFKAVKAEPADKAFVRTIENAFQISDIRRPIRLTAAKVD